MERLSEAAEQAMVGGSPAEVLDAPGRLIVTPHPVLLDGQRNVTAEILPGESLADFLARHAPEVAGESWSVSIGGFEVPQAMWRHTFPHHGQIISCRAAVHKSALKFIVYAALVFVLAGTIGLVIAGAALVVKALKPKVPSATNYGSAAQVYSLSGQRNQARQYAPIGTLLGEMRVTPDLASNPYTWFESDDQYLSTILLGGINVDSYTDLSVGDTPLSSFSDVTVYSNGFSGMASQSVPLFSNADSIAGGTLEDTTAWVVRTSSAHAVMLQVDLEYQLFRQGDSGLENATLNVQAEYRAVGAGTWLTFASQTFINKTQETRRVTWSKEVADGQYEVRARRTDGVNPDRVTRTVQWTTLRTVQPDATDYSGWGRIGIRIRATGQLNGSLDTLRATFKPRPLPVWDGSAWVNATTRPGVSNPGALVLQVLRGIYDGDVLQFGYGLSDDQIDIEGLKGFILHCTANGYTYDKWITEQISLGTLLEEISLAGMGQFMWLDGSRPTVRWAADDQPLGGVVNMANMGRGSFSVSYQLTNAADGIEYQYVDRDRGFETVTLRVMAPGVTTMLNPARLTGEGVTTEAHAAIMARYHLAQTLYQYKEIGFDADIERLDYQRMSMLSLSHDMTQWGYGGRLIDAQVVGSDIVLTLDEPVPSLPTRFVGLRVPGELSYRVFSVAAFTGPSDQLTLIGTWPSGVAFPGDSSDNPAHDTLWCYDVKATPGYRVRVVSIEPDQDLKNASVRVVPEGDEFWNYVLTGTYVPAPSESLIPQLDAPAVLNIRVQAQTNVQGNTDWVQLNVVWDSTGDLDHCQVWAAIDGRPLRLVDGQAVGNRSSFRIDENGNWLIQVRPFDPKGMPGTSNSVIYAASAINQPPPNVDIFSVDEVDGGLRRYRFGYSGAVPSIYAGVQIRYRSGSTAVVLSDWDSLTPLGTATDIYTQAAESTLPAAGTWTFACRAISTAGVLANSVAQVTVTLAGTFSDIISSDPTPAPTPTGVVITPGFSRLIVEHDQPTYTQGHGHGKTRVFGVIYTGGAEPVISSATVLGEFSGVIGSVPVDLGTTWRIWVKWVTVDGYESTTAAGGTGTNGIAVTVGKVGNSDLNDSIITAAKLADGSVSASKVAAGAVDLTKFASGIEPVSVITGALPTTFVTRAIMLTSDSKIYRWNGSAYVASVPTTDLSGQITSTQITDGAISTPKLAAGAVTATNIAANTITSAQIAANTITAGQIAAGAIGANQIAANAITTDKLLVTGRGPALNDDPAIADLSAWTVAAGISVNGPSTAAGATGGLYFSNSSGGSDALVYSRAMPVDPAKTYSLTANLYAATGNNRNMYVFVVMYDENGTQLTGAETGWGGSLSGYVYGGQPPTGQWSRQGGQFGAGVAARPIPSNVKTVRVGIWFQYSGGGGSSSVQQGAQDIRLERATDASLVVDGAIIAGKLAAGAIAVGSAAIQDGAIRNALIENLAVDSAKIANGAIVTAKIGDAQITAAKIADATITTAKIANAQITSALIADANITTAKIADGQITTAKIGDAQVTSAKVGVLTAGNLTVSALSGTVNGGASSTSARIEITTNRVDVFDASNVRRVRLGLL